MTARCVRWKTRDGKNLKLHEIGDAHLRNIIKLIERRYELRLASAYSVAGMVQGEMASYYSEQDCAILEGEGPGIVDDRYDALLAEFKRRGLKR